MPPEPGERREKRAGLCVRHINALGVLSGVNLDVGIGLLHNRLAAHIREECVVLRLEVGNISTELSRDAGVSVKANGGDRGEIVAIRAKARRNEEVFADTPHGGTLPIVGVGREHEAGRDKHVGHGIVRGHTLGVNDVDRFVLLPVHVVNELARNVCAVKARHFIPRHAVECFVQSAVRAKSEHARFRGIPHDEVHHVVDSGRVGYGCSVVICVSCGAKRDVLISLELVPPTNRGASEVVRQGSADRKGGRIHGVDLSVGRPEEVSFEVAKRVLDSGNGIDSAVEGELVRRSGPEIRVPTHTLIRAFSDPVIANPIDELRPDF